MSIQIIWYRSDRFRFKKTNILLDLSDKRSRPFLFSESLLSHVSILPSKGVKIIKSLPTALFVLEYLSDSLGFAGRGERVSLPCY